MLVIKEPNPDAKPIRTPTRVTIWGDVTWNEPVALPNYPYGVITNLQVIVINQNNRPLPSEEAQWKRNGEVLSFDKSDRVEITYQIQHYRPEDITINFPEELLQEDERKDLDRYFGAELETFLGEAKGDPLQAIRKFMKARTHYAADETKSFALAPKGTWAFSLMLATRGYEGAKASVICNTAAMINHLLASYFHIPSIYVGQIIPDRMGFFGRKTVLTEATDGHAAIFVKPQGSNHWKYEEAVANVGPRPVMLDLPNARTIGVYVSRDAVRDFFLDVRNAIVGFFTWFHPSNLAYAMKFVYRQILWRTLAVLSWLPDYWRFRQNSRDAKHIFEFLGIEKAESKDHVRTILRRLHEFNRNRFWAKYEYAVERPRLDFAYLRQENFWRDLEKWKNLDPTGKVIHDPDFLSSIFIYGDLKRGVEWDIPLQGRSELRLAEQPSTGQRWDATHPQSGLHSSRSASRGELRALKPLRKIWSPVYAYISSGEKGSIIFNPATIEKGEALLELGLTSGAWDEVLKVMEFSDAILGAYIEDSENILRRLYELALQDLKIATHVIDYLVDPISTKSLKAEERRQVVRLHFLKPFYHKYPEANEYFTGRERIWVEWLLFGAGMAFETADGIEGVRETGDLIAPEVVERFGKEMSLGWLIDAAKFRNMTGVNGDVTLSKISATMVYAGRNRTAPLSEREMLATIAAQDRTRMVMIRELIQNARDAIRENRDQLKARGKKAEIQVRSFLNKMGEQIRWVVSVHDPVGMSLETLFLKYFPPKATTKSVDEVLKEILRRKRPVEQKVEAILDLFEEEHRKDRDIQNWLFEHLQSQENFEVLAQKMLQEFSSRFKKALGTGFFGVGNYTIFADADEVIIRTGRDGKVYEVRVRVDRHDTEDPQKVTGLVLLSKKEYVDSNGQYEGTLIQRIKNVENLEGTYLEDRQMKYLFSEYVGAVDDVPIIFVNENEEPLDIPIRDRLEVLASYGKGNRVQVVQSQMGITRLTVDKLFIQANRDPVLYQYVPQWLLRWMNQLAVGLNFAMGTRVSESRTALSYPELERNDVAVSVLKAYIHMFRIGKVRFPTFSDRHQFLRDLDWDDPPIRDPAIVQDAQTINEGKLLEDETWEKYAKDVRRLSALLLLIDAPGVGGTEKSLQQEKEEIFFHFVPHWLGTVFEMNPNFKEALREEDFSGGTYFLETPDQLSRYIAIQFFKAALVLYASGKLSIPGLPAIGTYLNLETKPLAVSEEVRQDVARIRDRQTEEIDFAKYQKNKSLLASLLVSLPLKDQKSLNQMKEKMWEKERARREAELAGKPTGAQVQTPQKIELTVKVDTSEYAILQIFEQFLNSVFTILDQNVNPKHLAVKLGEKVSWNFSEGDGIEILKTFSRFLNEEPDGDQIFEQVLKSMVRGDVSNSAISYYVSLLSGRISAQAIRNQISFENDPAISLGALETRVRETREKIYYEYHHARSELRTVSQKQLASFGASFLRILEGVILTPALSPFVLGSAASLLIRALPGQTVFGDWVKRFVQRVLPQHAPILILEKQIPQEMSRPPTLPTPFAIRFSVTLFAAYQIAQIVLSMTQNFSVSIIAGVVTLINAWWVLLEPQSPFQDVSKTVLSQAPERMIDQTLGMGEEPSRSELRTLNNSNYINTNGVSVLERS
ncbi:MAG: hypothetical protein HY582_02065, partial [Candidatus Omnitrophica bacterium]|nr:hypothetical protein [Candidatus Omnitrophota bacterium]